MSKINKLGQYKELEVTVKKETVSDEEVEKQLAAFVANNPTAVDKDGVVENGDTAIIDFEGFKDGIPFEGGKSENYPLVIGSGSFIPGFEEQMIGMAKGETKDLNLTFPVNYPATDLAGAEVVFKVTVHNIQTKKDSELTDEFAASLNIPEVSTVEDLRKTMRSHLELQLHDKYTQSVETAVFEAVLANSEVELDNEDVQKVMDLQIQQISISLAQQGMMFDNYLQMIGKTKEDFLETLRPAAEKEAKFEAIIDEIVNVEGLQVDDEEANKQIDGIAAQHKITREQVFAQLPLENVKRDYSRVKASQLVLQTAKINN